MKIIVLIIAVFTAYAVAAPSHDNVYIDVAMNILKHPSRGRIAGGQNAERQQFPHQVSLRWSAAGTRTHICGGSIIGENTILTAAHCKPYSHGSYDIVVGLLNRSDANPIVIPLHSNSWILHEGYPEYSGTVAPYDIALILLDEKLEFTDAIQPIQLGSSRHSDISNFSKATVSGWGQTYGFGPLPDELKWVTVARMNNVQCYADLKKILSGRDHPLDDSMLCISNGTFGNFKGACGGDSGGCLFVEDNGERYQIGVVSWGISPCGPIGAPSVFTDVAQYRDWIDEHTQN